ncbi:MAG: glycosyltransferase family 2 protein [Bdellovibrionaceae bacterium]|nr:glycosyltransferase family 2 protein [Pseudobdellovibrionaceae bacterium]
MIDIVIVTSDRLQLLVECIRSLEVAALDLNIRVLIGFNGSTSSFIESAKKILNSFRFLGGIKFFTLDKKWPGAARNELLRLAEADWIFFCDDDVLVPENIFKNFIALNKAFPKINVFGGPNITPPSSTPVERAQGYALSLSLVTGPMNRRYSPYFKRSELFVSGYLGLTLCNLFWKRMSSVFFPEDYICGEELHLLHSTPRPFVLSSQLSVYHFRRTTWRSFFQQTYKYGIGRAHESFLVIPAVWLLAVALLTIVILKPVVLLLLSTLFAVAILMQAVGLIRRQHEKLNLIYLTMFAAFLIWTGYTLGMMFGRMNQILFKPKLTYAES